MLAQDARRKQGRARRLGMVRAPGIEPATYGL